jgi:hypothetical protein
VPIAVPTEEPEHSRGSIGEEVHEHGSPENPGKVTGFLPDI